MNERDWADWIAIGASVLSSFGILATIGVYFWQKKDSDKLNIKIQKSICNVLIDGVSNTIKNINNIIEIKKILDADRANSKSGEWVIFKLESMVIFLSRYHKKRWIIKNGINPPLDSVLTTSMGVYDNIISDILFMSNLNRDIEIYSESAFQMHIPEDSDGLTKLVMRNKLIIDCAKMDNYFRNAYKFNKQIKLLEEIKNKCEN